MKENIPFTLTDAFSTVVLNLKHFLKSKSGSQVILVVSALPHEGRSTAVKNLGIALASESFKVVIVDCDLRNSAKIFEVPASDSIGKKFSDENFAQKTSCKQPHA